jgi:hypothetical protein
MSPSIVLVLIVALAVLAFQIGKARSIAVSSSFEGRSRSIQTAVSNAARSSPARTKRPDWLA